MRAPFRHPFFFNSLLKLLSIQFQFSKLSKRKKNSLIIKVEFFLLFLWYFHPTHGHDLVCHIKNTFVIAKDKQKKLLILLFGSIKTHNKIEVKTFALTMALLCISLDGNLSYVNEKNYFNSQIDYLFFPL